MKVFPARPTSPIGAAARSPERQQGVGRHRGRVLSSAWVRYVQAIQHTGGHDLRLSAGPMPTATGYCLQSRHSIVDAASAVGVKTSARSTPSARCRRCSRQTSGGVPDRACWPTWMCRSMPASGRFVLVLPPTRLWMCAGTAGRSVREGRRRQAKRRPL
jgi:hypothetical protein